MGGFWGRPNYNREEVNWGYKGVRGCALGVDSQVVTLRKHSLEKRQAKDSRDWPRQKGYDRKKKVSDKWVTASQAGVLPQLPGERDGDAGKAGHVGGDE